jgi:hypothetical protein
MVTPFHKDVRKIVCFDGATYVPLEKDVKQGCVSVSTLFPISFRCIFIMLLPTACEESVFMKTRADGKLFNIARLCATTKVGNPHSKEAVRRRRSADVSNRGWSTEAGLSPASCL